MQGLLQELLAGQRAGISASGSSSSGGLIAALDALPEAFTRRRLPDVHALVWLDENARAFRGQLVGGFWAPSGRITVQLACLCCTLM